MQLPEGKLRSSLGIYLLAGAALGFGSDQARVLIEPRVSQAERERTKPEIRVDSDLVLIPVSVVDSKNRVVTGLRPGDFRLFEDKVERKVVEFSTEEVPVSVGVVFDCSGSMGSKVDASREAVTRFFRTANSSDEFFLIDFKDRPRLAVSFTRTSESISNQLASAEPEGRTALLDAVYLGLELMKTARNAHKALLVISDGRDNASRYTATELRDVIRETDTAIYVVGVYRQSVMLPEEEPEGRRLLDSLADESGGRHYAVSSADQIPAVAEQIGKTLRTQYLLGFKPLAKSRDGKYRQVRVQLIRPRGLQVTSRRGYYSRAY